MFVSKNLLYVKNFLPGIMLLSSGPDVIVLAHQDEGDESGTTWGLSGIGSVLISIFGAAATGSSFLKVVLFIETAGYLRRALLCKTSIGTKNIKKEQPTHRDCPSTHNN